MPDYSIWFKMSMSVWFSLVPFSVYLVLELPVLFYHFVVWTIYGGFEWHRFEIIGLFMIVPIIGVLLTIGLIGFIGSFLENRFSNKGEPNE
ncbi:MAG: hypothetical protein JKY52_08435 [Flavobacteriales bacterium]|nr:hypothetical protein [Flavobacteriales bacterium]